jgi:enterobacterial common antigen flippase
MKSLFRATAILSGSSAVSIVLGLASSRVLATILHPSGYGYYGLLQSLVTVASLLCGMGMATGLVRLGAGAAKRNDYTTMASLCGGAWLLVALLGTPVLIVFALFRASISSWALGTPDHAGAILIMGVTLLFSVSMNIQNGILNAWHRVEALATYGIVNSVINAVTGILGVLFWRERGVVPAILASAILGWAASRYFLYRAVGAVRIRTTFHQKLAAARKLLAFGAPYTASVMAGNGIQLAMPMVVVHLLNADGVGYYKAATAISVGYLGFLVAAMTQDYYPRVSAVRDQPRLLISIINEQHRLIMLLAAPIILCALALVPYLVPLVYSRRFMPAVDILEWQLIGDFFRFSSWTLSFAILARCKPSMYFLTESLSGIITLSTTWIAVRLFGLQGLGIGFIVANVLYCCVVWIVLRRELPLKWTAYNRNLLLASLAAAFTIRLLPITPLAHFRTLIALILTGVFGAYSVRALWSEYQEDRVHNSTSRPTTSLPTANLPVVTGSEAEV